MHAASARACVSPLIQDKIVPVYRIFGLSSERDPSKVCCSWKRHSEERSTEDVVLLGTVLRVFPNSLSGLSGLDRRAHLMKMMMISGRGDGGGKQVFRISSSSCGDPQRAQQF
jgi:hypothetical protein